MGEGESGRKGSLGKGVKAASESFVKPGWGRGEVGTG